MNTFKRLAKLLDNGTPLTTVLRKVKDFEFPSNVAIGTTLEDWAGAEALQLGSRTSLFNRSADNVTYLSNNAYYTGGWKYQDTAAASLYAQGGGGQHFFYVAPSGTEDSTISWATALYINNSGDANFIGNVAIGATLENWSGNWAVLQLGKNAALWASASTEQTILSSNAYFNSAWYYMDSDYATHFEQNVGQFRFYVAPSGTADTSISWTTALTIENSGSVKLGRHIRAPDNYGFLAGSSDDLQMVHTASISYIKNHTGTFNIEQKVTSGILVLSSYNSADALKTGIVVGGATPYVRLYYDGTKVFETVSSGVSLGVSQFLYLGGTGGVQAYHDGSDGYINNQTGNFYIRPRTSSAELILQSENSVGTIQNGIKIGGAITYVRLHYAGINVCETSIYGLKFGNFADADTTKELLQFRPSDYTTGKPYLTLKKTGAAKYSLLFWDGVTTAVGTLDINTYKTSITGSGGVVIGSPTGSYKGSGTLNAQAVYDDNVLLTDYVFDYHLDGKINPDDTPQAEKFLSDTSVLDINLFSDHWKTHRHLPSLPSREQWTNDGAHSIGELAQRLWETAEIQAVHIDNLNSRLKAGGL